MARRPSSPAAGVPADVQAVSPAAPVIVDDEPPADEQTGSPAGEPATRTVKLLGPAKIGGKWRKEGEELTLPEIFATSLIDDKIAEQG